MIESVRQGEEDRTDLGALAMDGFEHHSSFTKMNYILARWRARKVAPHARGKVLDAGCGIGTVLDYLNPSIEYVGVDLNPNHVKYLTERRPRARAYCLDIQRELPAEEGPFDTILNLAVIEHLEDPESFLRNCHGLLKPGGKMVITTPTRFGERARDLLARLGLVQRSVEGEKVHGHVNIFTRESIIRLLEECGFRVIRAGYFQLWMNMLVVGVKDGAGETGGAS